MLPFRTFAFLRCTKYISYNTQRNSSKFIPRRAVLYVPGDDVRKISKIKELNADCIVLDCEDGVALSKKAQAREEISALLSSDFANQKSEIAVRLNSIESGMFEEDLRSIVCDKYPATVVLPKLNTPAEAEFFAESLKKHVNRENLKTPINLIFISESCRSILRLPEICESLAELSKRTGLFEPAAIMFGSDDFCASLGATRSENSEEILYARQRLVLIAKAYGLQAIDMVDINYKDLIGLKTLSEEGARYGYTGKQIIHPTQIDTVQEAFLPSKDKISWASQLLEEFAIFQSEGKGAFVFRNQMIDMPTVKQAMNILDVIKKHKKVEEKIPVV